MTGLGAFIKLHHVVEKGEDLPTTSSCGGAWNLLARAA